MVSQQRGCSLMQRCNQLQHVHGWFRHARTTLPWSVCPKPPQAPRAARIHASSSTTLKLKIIGVPGSQADTMADHLMKLGAMSAGVEEFRQLKEEEQQIYGDGGAVWDRCIVHGLFRAQPNMQMIQEHLRVLTNGPPLQFEVEHIQDQEWLESIRHSYQPAQIDEGLWIVPTWCKPKDASAVNIRLEPGIAFGTGDHPTTRLCLKALLDLDLCGKTVMDYGTGSGVLAIAALKLGAAQAYGTDTDALAVRAAAQNATLNALKERFQAVRCDASAEGPEPLAAGLALAPASGAFDVVMANILQGPLLGLQNRLCMYARPGGVMVLSGFLVGQWPAIRAAYASDCRDFRVRQEGQWLAVTCTRGEHEATSRSCADQ